MLKKAGPIMNGCCKKKTIHTRMSPGLSEIMFTLGGVVAGVAVSLFSRIILVMPLRIIFGV